jgi:GTPase SAR1 family protein
MAGYLLVVDGTRRATLDVARQLQEKALETVGPVPFILLLNKTDLQDRWEIDEPAFFKLVDQGWRVVKTSAKTGEGVDRAFELLAQAMLQPRPSL